MIRTVSADRVQAGMVVYDAEGTVATVTKTRYQPTKHESLAPYCIIDLIRERDGAPKQFRFLADVQVPVLAWSDDA